MRARIDCELIVGKKSYRIYIDCRMDYNDMRGIDNNCVSINCKHPSIDLKSSHKDYKNVFEVTIGEDLRLLIKFKKRPEDIRILTKYNEFREPKWQIQIKGEYKPNV